MNLCTGSIHIALQFTSSAPRPQFKNMPAKVLSKSTPPSCQKLYGRVVQSITPFMQLSRLDMLCGSMLVFWPTAWSLTMAARTEKLSLETYSIYLALSFIGSVVHHSVACVWNDIVDIELDRQVERTKKRPLARGAMGVSAALVYAVPQAAFCLGLLYLTNPTAFFVGSVGLFFLDTVYPYMKRITYWPQAWLGIAINWGALVSWTAVTSSDKIQPAVVLLAATWCWTMHYDTCYGAQDKKDDVKAGIKSTALLFKHNTHRVVAGFSASFLALLAYAGYLNGQGAAFFFISVIGCAFHLAWQLSRLNIDDSRSCFEIFSSNGNRLGYIVWLGCFVDYML
ncbi:UbiA prenyltransferase family-domain-containing protein [Hygrophoropsis aurantiaca]|uniref:UbiA prenyltransferase family-domain-containing protein n=1 Tax=Hygrophoropsis aurantiaca TaxID=72124 RepID=A0ACB8A0F6_9AGAM|nr:UbiA prenyltransferase family-domain-containing protein [Hygrophoropsis aurantiaca]